MKDQSATGPNAPDRPERRPAAEQSDAASAVGRAAPHPAEPSPPWAPSAPTDELPEIAKKADDLEAIKAAVDDATSVGGGLRLSYLFVLFYLAVAAGAVTHADLFLENPVKLPFLNIELPLLAFFFLAPILFLVVHAYTLVHRRSAPPSPASWGKIAPTRRSTSSLGCRVDSLLPIRRPPPDAPRSATNRT